MLVWLLKENPMKNSNIGPHAYYLLMMKVYSEGEKAYMSGCSRETNPYIDDDHDLSRIWLDGYMDASWSD